MALTEQERKDRRRETKARYREKNREQIRAQGREYQAARRQDPDYVARQAEYQRTLRAERPEHVAEIKRRFAEKHPGYDAQWAREWRAANPGVDAQRARDSYAADPSPRRRAAAKYAAANREKVNARMRDWFERNPGKKATYTQARRARKHAAGGTFTLAEWRSACAQFRHRCAYCGEKTTLTMDHVVPISRGGSHSADNIVPACKSCNCRKNARTYEEFVGGLF